MDLRTYLTEKSVDVADFARDLGVSKEAVRLWMTGERTPRSEAMRRIVEETKGAVTPNDFLAPAHPEAAE